MEEPKQTEPAVENGDAQVNGNEPAQENEDYDINIEVKLENEYDDLEVVDETVEDNEDQETQEPTTVREHPHKNILDSFDFMELNTDYKNIKNIKKPGPVNPKQIVEIKTKTLLTEISERLMTTKTLSVHLECSTHGYNPVIALIQIGTFKETYLIDAIELKDDLHILSDLFLNSKCTKIFHGAAKNLRWLQCGLGLYVCNIFDTLTAMKMLHFDDTSLRGYLAKNCKIFIDKGPQSVSFTQRPLTHVSKMLAASHVHYLYYLYVYLRMQLAKVGLLDVFLEKNHKMCYELYYPNDADKYEFGQFFLKDLNPEQLEAAKNINEWRKSLGQQLDLNCGIILSKKQFRSLIHEMPTSKEALLKITFSPHVKAHITQILKILLDAKKLAPTEENSTTEVEETVVEESEKPKAEKTYEPETVEQVFKDLTVLNDAQKDVLTKLNDWRNRVSLKIRKSPSAVLPRSVLRVLVIRNPTTKKELFTICRNIYIKAYVDEILAALEDGSKSKPAEVETGGTSTEGVSNNSATEPQPEAAVKEVIEEQCKLIFEDLTELSGVQLNLLKDLLIWRNNLAKKVALSPELIINKTHLRKLVIQMPTDKKLIKTIGYSPYVESYCNEIVNLLVKANEASGKRVVIAPVQTKSPQKPKTPRPAVKPETDKKFQSNFVKNRDRKRKFPFREERATKNGRFNSSRPPAPTFTPSSLPRERPSVNIWDKPNTNNPLPIAPIWQFPNSSSYSRNIRSDPPPSRYSDYPKSNVGRESQIHGNSNYPRYRDSFFREGNTSSRSDLNSSGIYSPRSSNRGSSSRFGGNKSRGGWAGSNFQSRGGPY